MAINKTKIKADLKPHQIPTSGPEAWYYREKTFFDIYVHSDAGHVINFRIYYKNVPKWAKKG